MIRVFILADTSDRSAALAAQLEEDDRFEISEQALADVILCAGISRQRLPIRGKPVVAISNLRSEEPYFDETVKAWLPATAQLDEISAALIAASAGFAVLTNEQAKQLFRIRPVSEERSIDIEPLTLREQEVLAMLASGLANKEIALRLGISPNTAKFHVRQIMSKMNADSRTEAVSIAMRRGLVPI